MPESLARCASCDAPIFWTLTRKLKNMPVDAEPVEVAKGFRLVDRDGALVDPAEEEGEGRVPRAVYTAAPEPGERLYVSHYATCPQAAQWRR